MIHQPPAGTRDLLPLEVTQKGWINDRLQSVFQRWGYQRIVTSTIEWLDTLTAGGAIDPSTVIQLHGHEPPELAAALGRRFPVLKAFAVRGPEDLDAIHGYPADAYLLDAAVPGQAGGTGVAWDHHLLVGRDLGRPVVLAGGLTPETVGPAAAAVRPWAVDVASGIESAPGLKDAGRMAAFVRALRE